MASFPPPGHGHLCRPCCKSDLGIDVQIFDRLLLCLIRARERRHDHRESRELDLRVATSADGTYKMSVLCSGWSASGPVRWHPRSVTLRSRNRVWLVPGRSRNCTKVRTAAVVAVFRTGEGAAGTHLRPVGPSPIPAHNSSGKHCLQCARPGSREDHGFLPGNAAAFSGDCWNAAERGAECVAPHNRPPPELRAHP